MTAAAEYASGCRERAAALARRPLAFARRHRIALVVLAFAWLNALAFCVLPQEQAHALPLPAIIGGLAAVLGGTALVTATDVVSGWLRTVVNGLVDINSALFSLTMDSSLLLKNFGDIWSEYAVVETLRGIQQSAVMPVAYVALAIVFVWGVARVLQNAGYSEGGIDVWKIYVLLFMFAVGKAVIDSSFEILVAMYTAALDVIQSTADTGLAAAGARATMVPEDVVNEGVLLIMVIAMLLMLLFSLVMFLAVQGAIIVRMVQVLAYVWIAPFPLAFIVSESARPVATGFLKRFAGTLIAGAFLMLLFVIFTTLMGSMQLTTVSPNSYENVMVWIAEMFASAPPMIAFAYCCLKSGAWGREIMGVS